MDDFVPLMIHLFPDSTVAQCLKGNRKIVSSDIREKLGKVLQKNTIAHMRENKFTFFIDSMTDITNSHVTAYLVRFFDEKQSLYCHQIYKLRNLENTESETIFQDIVQCLENDMIPQNNLLGFCTDGASNFVGGKNGLGVLLENRFPNC